MLGTASDMSGMFANVMTSPEELRQDMTKRIDRVEGRAQQGHEGLGDDLADRRDTASQE